MSAVFVGSSLPKDAREGDIWIAEVWADRMLTAINPKHVSYQRAFMQWLRASLEADLSPDWLIEMVMEDFLTDPLYIGRTCHVEKLPPVYWTPSTKTP